MAKLLAEDVKRAAEGRWPEILASVAGIPADSLDPGREHPCPKCGGNTRFRLVDEKAGACYCSHCLTNGCGDGLAVVEWMLGGTFPEAIQAVGEHLGMTPAKERKPPQLRFVAWNDRQAALFCARKPPIAVAALLRVGAKMAMYRGQWKVIALPVWSNLERTGKPCGWVMYHIAGGRLPKFDKSGQVEEWVKVKVLAGSKPGVIGYVATA